MATAQIQTQDLQIIQYKQVYECFISSANAVAPTVGLTCYCEEDYSDDSHWQKPPEIHLKIDLRPYSQHFILIVA